MKLEYLEKFSESGRRYYMTNCEDTVPFTYITEEEVRNAPRPFICNEVHPSTGLGVVLNDMRRVIIDIPYTPTHHRAKRERNIANRNADTETNRLLISPKRLDPTMIWRAGKAHFNRWGIDFVEIEHLVEYMKDEGLEGLLVDVVGENGHTFSQDFTILDQEGKMGWPGTGYGIFCCWDYAYPKRKLGRYSILQVVEALEMLGYSRYDLGAADDPRFGDCCAYKNDFATHYEQSRGLFLVDPDDPLVEELAMDRTRINLLREGEPLLPQK